MEEDRPRPTEAPTTPERRPIVPPPFDDDPDNQPNSSQPTVDDRPPVAPPQPDPGPVTPPPRSE